MMPYLNEMLIAIIGTIGTVLITWLASTLNKFIKNKDLNETKTAFLNQLSNLIFDSVRNVQQTFVDSLKSEKDFNDEQQQEALNKAKEIIFINLPRDLLKFLHSYTPHLNDFIELKIESTLNYLKKKESNV